MISKEISKGHMDVLTESYLKTSFQLWNAISSDTINVTVVFNDSFHRHPCQMPEAAVISS